MELQRTIFNIRHPLVHRLRERSAKTTTAQVSNNDKLNGLITRAHRILIKVNTVFPFDFFPDTIIVDANKIDVIRRPFFFTEEIYTLLIRNINYVSVYHSLFFATLSIEVNGFEQNPPNVNYLWKNDAVRIRNIVLGLLACAKENIDT